jgi:hypothetical protein
MKRYSHVFASLFAALAIAVTLAVAGAAGAQGGFNAQDIGLSEAGGSAGYTVGQSCEDQEGGCIPQLVGQLISALLGLFGALFLVLIIWGGVQYMTSGGDPGKVKHAKETLVNAIVGMLIVALSYAIARYVIIAVSGAVGGGSDVAI